MAQGWSGPISYVFGTRRLTDQWVVQLDAGQDNGTRIRRGDSGAVWMSSEGVVVGLQVAVLGYTPQYALVTPFEAICNTFNVAVAG